ncbi:MAG: ribonuclease III domain-containing protein [Verrucomicrobiota bacterium]
MKRRKAEEEKQKEQELAWIGDSVLDLYARSWILRQGKGLDGPQAQRMTSNQFLSCFGNPTAVEAEIGTIYEEKGLETAFEWIEAELIPLFLKQEKNR